MAKRPDPSKPRRRALLPRDPDAPTTNVIELQAPKATEKPYAPAARAGKLVHAQRRAAVLRLRRSGATTEDISRAMTQQGDPITPQGVERIIVRALEELRGSALHDVENVRAGQLDRIDAMIAQLWPLVLDKNLKAIDRVTNLERLRARIAGTEAPQRIEHAGLVEHRISREEVNHLQSLWLESGGIEGTAEPVS